MEIKSEPSELIVISLGGSIIAPDKVDIDFLKKFREIILNSNHKYIIICGGGKVCRNYQSDAKLISNVSNDDLDWIGIMASRLNAELVRSSFSDSAFERVINNPFEEFDFNDKLKIVIGAGYKPGSSTDLRAVQFAKRFSAKVIINMSNIDYVYDSDPNVNKDAKIVKELSWGNYIELIGKDWNPGFNSPFDPIAAKYALENSQEVIICGSNLENFNKIINKKEFNGTVLR